MNNKFKLKSVLVTLTIVTILSSCSGKLINTTISTNYGKVEGLANETETVVAFKGIPYAEAPVGDLRWKEPHPPLAWDGVRDATQFCASCEQNKAVSRLPWTEEFMVQNEISEDCLFLNIWTPAKKASDKLAVLVYIHGGGFTEGSGSIEMYDGEELAKKGIIVVTINYRLGIFGLLAHPELTAESSNNASGNYGLLDQIAALTWVRDNISAFGGDPGRVTIAGQSAGAGAVRSLIISPLAKGLFHRAITESGSSFTGIENGTKLSDAEAMGVEFAKRKGATSLAELRAMTVEELMAPDTIRPSVRFSTIIDGYCITGTIQDIFDAGKQNDTPFMTGMNMGELRYGGERNNTYYDLYLATAEGDSLKAEQTAAQEYSRLNAYLWLDYRQKHQIPTVMFITLTVPFLGLSIRNSVLFIQVKFPMFSIT